MSSANFAQILKKEKNAGGSNGIQTYNHLVRKRTLNS